MKTILSKSLQNSYINDTISKLAFERKLQEEFYSNGFLNFDIDSITNFDSKWNYFIRLNNQYLFKTIKVNASENDWVNWEKIKKSVDKYYSPSGMSHMFSLVLDDYNNNGYPFASIALNNLSIVNDTIKANINVSKNELILFDSIAVKGDANISENYLYKYLGYHVDDAFDGSVLIQLKNRLDEIPFVFVAKSPDVEFFANKARPVIYLQKKKASFFNGIIGFQPDNSNPGKIFLTGDVKMKLLNSFGRAELFELNWSNPLPRTQDLKVKLNYPFILGLPFGADLELSLFKKDTIFLDVNRNIGGRFIFSGNSYLKMYVGKRSSTLISTYGYKNIQVLPTYADIQYVNYGMELSFERLDYRLNPQKGISLLINTGSANRQIKKNSKVNEAVYDSIDLKTLQFKVEGNFDSYLPLVNRTVLNIGAVFGLNYGKSLFQNELFRIGGLKTLRGFDEQSILSSKYEVAKVELRYLLEKNAYVSGFYNNALLIDQTNVQRQLYGFGLGVTFETQVGFFNFNYAIGTQDNSQLLLRAAKVHFGMISYF